MAAQPFISLMLAGALLAPAGRAAAAGALSLVEKGNEAYAAGRLDEAAHAYQEATVDLPESPHLAFNQGAVCYRRGDYTGAVERFQKAAVQSRDTALEASARFNLGNCAYRGAERLKDSDLQKAIESCQTAVRHYQDALALQPEFKEAAENIEIVRLVMKSILDEINKRKEEGAKQEAAAKKIEELLRRQQDLLRRTETAAGGAGTNAAPDQARSLGQEQRTLGQDTRSLAAQMSEAQTNAPPQAAQAGTNLLAAADRQDAATGRLEENQPPSAVPEQQAATNYLQQALDAFRGQPQGQQGQQGQQDQQQQQQQQKQEPEQGGQASQDKQQGGQPEQPEQGVETNREQEAQGQLSDDARDILDEEKENRERERRQPGGYQPVDRDW